MIDIIRDPSQLPGWTAAADGETVDWTEVLEGWEAIGRLARLHVLQAAHGDLARGPGPAHGARPREAWYRSVENSIYAAKELAMRGELTPPEENPPSPEVMQMINGLIWDGTFHGRFAEKDYAIEVFNDHIADVKATVPAERLTVYEIGQGWGPLADMMGVEAPDEPFPHLNDTESFRQMFGMPAVPA